MIERKHNKHDGLAPTKDKLGVRHGSSSAAYVWPKFKRGTKPPGPPEPVA